MKRKTKRIIAAIALAGMFLLGSCGNGQAMAAAQQDYPLKIYAQNDNGWYHTLEVIDDDTGVNYVVVAEVNGGIAITPRLNADGSLYVSH